MRSCVETVPLKSLLWAVGASAMVIGCGALASLRGIPAVTSVPVFMLITIVVAWRGGFRASLAVAVAATLGFDFFLTEPRYSLEVATSRDVFALLSFGATSTLVSHLSSRIRIKSDLLRHAGEQQRSLYEFSRSALLVDWKENVEEQLSALIQDQFRLRGVALWNAQSSTSAAFGDTARSSERLEAAFRAKRNYDLPTHRESIRILKFGAREIGALLMHGEMEPVMADAIGTLAATHLERVRSLRSEVTAQSQAVSERLRTAVLDGLAHAVKTPLTTIIVSSSGLWELGELTPLQADLARVIESQATYLSGLTDKLLRTAKLEACDVRVQPRATSLSAMLTVVLAELRTAYEVSRVHVVGLPSRSVWIDPDLLQLIFAQVLENALKYSSTDSSVEVRFSEPDDVFAFSVHNQDSFIPAKEQALIFERYYRANATEHKASGTGIGLSVTRQAVQAQGGHIRVESTAAEGTTFYIWLPITVSGEENASGLGVDR